MNYFVLLCLMFSISVQAKYKKMLNLAEFKKVIKNPKVKVLDIRSEIEYAKGHMPGSINIPAYRTFSKVENRKYMIGNTLEIVTLLSNSGISSDDTIAIYDNGSLLDGARFMWLLELYGQKKHYMLNGGIEVLKKSKTKFVTYVPSVDPKKFRANFSPEVLASKRDVMLSITNPNVELLDVRTPDEYGGNSSFTYRYGHIKSAINTPMINFVNTKDGNRTLKSDTKVRDILKSLDKTKSYITYCNKGEDSTVVFLIMRELGFDVRSYDGSWYEWSQDMTLPSVKSISR